MARVKSTSANTAAPASAASAAEPVAPSSVPAPAPEVEIALALSPVAVAAGEKNDAPAVGAPVGAAERVVLAIERVNGLAAVVKDLGASLKDFSVLLKALQKDVQREGSKRSRRSAPAAPATDADGNVIARKPSGFAKPAQLSAELCEFLGVPESTLMARTEVTRLITKYVRDNELYGTNKRNILPDGKLLKLLAAKETDLINYFNLQAHIKHHFIKSGVDAGVAAGGATPAVAAAVEIAV